MSHSDDPLERMWNTPIPFEEMAAASHRRLEQKLKREDEAGIVRLSTFQFGFYDYLYRYDIMQFTVAQIAEQIGSPAGVVKGRIFQGIAQGVIKASSLRIDEQTEFHVIDMACILHLLREQAKYYQEMSEQLGISLPESMARLDFRSYL